MCSTRGRVVKAIETRNLLGSARAGSNPAECEPFSTRQLGIPLLHFCYTGHFDLHRADLLYKNRVDSTSLLVVFLESG